MFLVKLSIPLTTLNGPSIEYLTSQREIERRRLLQAYEVAKKQHQRSKMPTVETPRCTSSQSYYNTSDESLSTYTNSDYSRYNSRYNSLKSNDLNDLNDVYNFYTPASARSAKSSFGYRY